MTTVDDFVALPVWGIHNTIISIVAYNMGAGYRDRVRRIIAIAMKASAIIMVVGTVLYEAISQVLLGIFSASGEMMEIGVPAFRIIGITLILSGGASVESSIRARQSALWADRQAFQACRLVTS